MKNCYVVHENRNGPTYWLTREGDFTVDDSKAHAMSQAQALKMAERVADEYGYSVKVVTREKSRAKNPVPPSSRAGRGGHGRTLTERAGKLYSRFTGHKAGKVQHHAEDDRAWTKIGTLDGILYTTNRDGKVEQYIHHFHPRSRPALLVSHDGKVARSHGGHFTFTERGFVDEDANGRPVE